jgi:hypothetical protein
MKNAKHLQGNAQTAGSLPCLVPGLTLGSFGVQSEVTLLATPIDENESNYSDCEEDVPFDAFKESHDGIKHWYPLSRIGEQIANR